MTKLTFAGFVAASSLAFAPAAALAQAVEVGPGGVTVHSGPSEHRERRVIEEHHAPVVEHHAPVVEHHPPVVEHHDSTSSVTVERRTDHHD